MLHVDAIGLVPDTQVVERPNVVPKTTIYVCWKKQDDRNRKLTNPFPFPNLLASSSC